MTDSNPIDDRDALASSYLDGLTTPAQTAQVEADPELVARVTGLLRVRAALALTTTVDEERRDQAIAAALAAYDEDPAVAPVSHLAEESGRRRAPTSRSWRVLGAAAAIAALVALVPLLASLSSSSPDDDRIELADDQPAGTADSSTASAEAMTSTTAPSPDPLATANWLAVLGSYATDEALVAAIGAPNVDSRPVAEVPPDVDRPPCFDVLIQGLPADETVVLTTATVAGAPVAVGVTPTEVRITGADCSPVRVYLR